MSIIVKLPKKAKVVDMTGRGWSCKERRFEVLLVVAFCIYGGVPGRAIGEPPPRTDEGPLSGAHSRWTVSRPLVGPVNHDDDI